MTPTSTFTYQSPYKPTPTSTTLDAFVRRLRLEKYRIEVTYGVYVYTPGEKAVFWTLFTLISACLATVALLCAHRGLTALLHAAAAAAISATSHVTSDQAAAVEKAMDLVVSGAAKNSQVAW